MSKLFGGKDPFDDPFFTQPFGGMFSGQNPFSSPFFTDLYGDQTGSKKEITVEELNPDDATENHSASNKEVTFKHPDSDSNEAKSFSYRRVAYGGLNGMYYSTSIGRRSGGDGVALLEIKEEDNTTGQALLTISKGIHEKGHSVSKKRNPEGREESLQILHNLNEGELTGFEEAWKANAVKHLTGWNDGFNFLENEGHSDSGWHRLANWDWRALPWPGHYQNYGAIEFPDGVESDSPASSGRAGPKKVVQVKID